MSPPDHAHRGLSRVGVVWFAVGLFVSGLLCLAVLMLSPQSVPSRLFRAVGLDLHRARGGPSLDAERLVVFEEGWVRPKRVIEMTTFDVLRPGSDVECRAVHVALFVTSGPEQSLWMPQRTIFGGSLSLMRVCGSDDPSAEIIDKTRRALVDALEANPSFATHPLFNADAIRAAEIPESGPLGRVSVRWTEPIPAGLVFNIASVAVIGSTAVAGVLCAVGRRRRASGPAELEDQSEADRPRPDDGEGGAPTE